MSSEGNSSRALPTLGYTVSSMPRPRNMRDQCCRHCLGYARSPAGCLGLDPIGFPGSRSAAQRMGRDRAARQRAPDLGIPPTGREIDKLWPAGARPRERLRVAAIAPPKPPGTTASSTSRHRQNMPSRRCRWLYRSIGRRRNAPAPPANQSARSARIPRRPHADILPSRRQSRR